VSSVSDGELQALNAQLEQLSPAARIEWSLQNLPGTHVLSSSFGAQAAVSLHLVASIAPRTPVILVDTQYLFPETYRFVDELTQRLGLDLRVYRPRHSASWIEARHGKLWEQGEPGIARYTEITKLEPFRRALDELQVGTWISGLRRAQSGTRSEVRVLERRDGRFKLQPIVEWSDRDVGLYLRRHDLPYHPLWDQGYVSIGDRTTTRSLAEAGDESRTRFFGLRRECGLHGLEG
jgi:phosphoadenosine phosphosulfate reductase